MASMREVAKAVSKALSVSLTTWIMKAHIQAIQATPVGKWDTS